MKTQKALSLSITETDSMCHTVFVPEGHEDDWRDAYEKDANEMAVRFENMQPDDIQVEAQTVQTVITMGYDELEELFASRGIELKVTERDRMVPIIGNGEDITTPLESFFGPIERYHPYHDEIEIWLADEKPYSGNSGVTEMPEKFDNYSEFSSYFNDHDDEFELVVDEFDAENHGWGVFLHNTTDRYFFTEQDENNADFTEVRVVARLEYDVNNDVLDKSGELLSELFDCDCCGECVREDGIEYLWFKEVKR